MASTTPKPPVPKKVPHVVKFGIVEGEERGKDVSKLMNPPLERVDDLFWLRDDDRKDPEVIAHLQAENDYTKSVTEKLKPAEEEIYAELKGHLKETDSSAPFPKGPWLYFHTTKEGLSYKTHCRRPREGSAAHQVILDENALAAGKSYCTVGAVAEAPSSDRIAYSVDNVGFETYELRVRDVSGADVDQSGAADVLVAPETEGSAEWGADDSALFYVTMDETHRPFKVWRHVRGSAPGADELLFTEDDERFNVGIAKSRSGRFIIVSSDSSETSEVWLLDLQNPSANLKCVAARETGVLYQVDHRGDTLFVVTNADGALDFKLCAAPLAEVLAAPKDRPAGRKAWAPVEGFPYDPLRKVDNVECFKDFLAVFGREGGLSAWWVLTPADKAAKEGSGGAGAWAARKWRAPEDAYEVSVGTNEEFDTPNVRIVYCSMVTPITWIDHNVAEAKDVTVKRTEVLNYDPSLYRTTRLEATAADGTKVSVSLVWRADRREAALAAKRPMPLLLDGYGSYGICCEPDFSYFRLPLLDRGLVYAVAHIRGGGEMGRAWYQLHGKYLKKKNTFSDFCAVAQHLVDAGWTAPDRLACVGRSAGGLLMGATLNLRPDLFRCCIAGVPFVDVLTTMSDASIPLTTGEWEEWGNPNEKEYFDYMAQYSPMDNIAERAYPAVLVTAGLHDPRVAYWEPAKWVARLREKNQGEHPILLKTELDAGHFSASDRYRLLRERAFEYTFLLNELGALKSA